MSEILIENGTLMEAFPFLSRFKNDEQAEKILNEYEIKERAIAVLVEEGEKPLGKKREINTLKQLFKDGEQKCFADVFNCLVKGDILYTLDRRVYANTTPYARERIKSDDKLYQICGLN